MEKNDIDRAYILWIHNILRHHFRHHFRTAGLKDKFINLCPSILPCMT